MALAGEVGVGSWGQLPPKQVS